MKKIITIILAVVLVLSFTACGAKTPSLDEVIAAVDEGKITFESALEKGWITEEWLTEYREENSVEAEDKFTSAMVKDFETKTITGETYTKDDLSKVTLICYITEGTVNGDEAINSIKAKYDEVKELGGDVVVVVGEDADFSKFKDLKCKVIIDNDSFEAGMGKYYEMMGGRDFGGAWNIEGSFLSSWGMKLDEKTLIDNAKSFVELSVNHDKDKEDGNAEQPTIMG